MTEKKLMASKQEGPILLTITGRYGVSADAPAPGTELDSLKDAPVGHQDDDGVEHYDDRVVTPFGYLGSLKSHVTETGDVVIDQADGVVLIARKDDWSDFPGVTVEPNPFGFLIFELKARNGIVRYALCADDVRWADRPDEEVDMQVGRLLVAQWTPEGPPPPRTKTVTTTKIVRTPE